MVPSTKASAELGELSIDFDAESLHCATPVAKSSVSTAKNAVLVGAPSVAQLILCRMASASGVILSRGACPISVDRLGVCSVAVGTIWKRATARVVRTRLVAV